MEVTSQMCWRMVCSMLDFLIVLLTVFIKEVMIVFQDLKMITPKNGFLIY